MLEKLTDLVMQQHLQINELERKQYCLTVYLYFPQQDINSSPRLFEYETDKKIESFLNFVLKFKQYTCFIAVNR